MASLQADWAYFYGYVETKQPQAKQSLVAKKTLAGQAPAGLQQRPRQR